MLPFTILFSHYPDEAYSLLSSLSTICISTTAASLKLYVKYFHFKHNLLPINNMSSGWGPVTGYCEHYDKPFGDLKTKEVIEYLGTISLS
jgi:hypothetical protein